VPAARVAEIEHRRQRLSEPVIARHLRTRPYTPRTNGKAERFIQTSPREWAYACPFATSHQRTAALTPWLDHYNTARPHTALAHQPPAIRLCQSAFLGASHGRASTWQFETPRRSF
jgi:transposase InsO family protein